MRNKSFNNYTFFVWLVVLLFIFTALTSSTCGDGRQRSSRDNSPGELKTLRLYIGCYAGEEEPGIYLFEFNLLTNEFKKIQELKGQNNPSFLAIDPEDRFLYAVNQISDYKGKNEGAIAAFSINKHTGILSFLNRQSSLGASPCHISVLPDGRHVAVANYTSGSVSILAVSDDGSLQKATDFVQHQGSGHHERRQRAPHAHSIYPHNRGSLVFAADLGIDKVMIYEFDSEGSLTPHSPTPSVSMEPGAGPRHLAIHTEGKWIYVINELNSTITRLLFDSNTGKVSVMESVSTLPEDYDGENYCADIHVHPGGRFLYASNRGHNSIAVFKLNHEGVPVLIGNEPVRGEWPRNFNIDPSGRLLFVANQNSGNITVFDIDNETGDLNFTGKELKINQPVCIVFSNL